MPAEIKESGHIGLNTIKKLMRSVTQKPITMDALAVMAMKLEEEVRKITRAAEKLLEKQNEFRKAQGLREKDLKKRITRNLILEVVENDKSI